MASPVSPMRVEIPVIASRQQRLLLCILFLLLLWPTAHLIQGWQWALFFPCWLLGLWCALRRSPAGERLVWDGEWLTWRGERHRLDPRSRILPGALWLRLRPEKPEKGAERQLWLFSDALSPEHYRTLARAIHLAVR
nr:protein YgfX [Aeromonas taiwanensis]